MDTVSRLSSKESKFLTIQVSLSLCEKSATLMLDKLISISITASALYVMEKGVLPVDLLSVVR